MFLRKTPTGTYQIGRMASAHTANQGCLLQALNYHHGEGRLAGSSLHYHPHFLPGNLGTAIMQMNDNVYRCGRNPEDSARIILMYERLAALVLVPSPILSCIAETHIPSTRGVCSDTEIKVWQAALPAAFEDFFASTDAYLSAHYTNEALLAHDIINVRNPTPTKELSSCTMMKEVPSTV